MKFFKSLLTDGQFATNDFTSESSRIDNVDLAGQAALSSALTNYVQATAAIGSTTVDARHFNGGDLVPAIAPAAPAIPDFNRFVHDVIAPIAQASRAQAVTAFDATTAQVVESTHAASTGAAPSADVVAPDVVPAAHAVDSTTIVTIVATATGPSTTSAEAGTAVTPVVGDDSAGAARSASEVPHASIEPVTVGTGVEGAEGVDATTASSSVVVADVRTGTTLEAISTTAVVAGSGGEGHATSAADLVDPVPIPRPADGVDRWENHGMFSVDPTHAIPTPASVDSTTTLANAVEAITVPQPQVHPVVGTVVIDPAHVPDSSLTDSIAGASVVDSTAIETILDGIDASKGETVTVIGSMPFPELADGLDFWNNHSMFSVDPTYTRPTPAPVEAITVPRPEVHAIVGTAIVDAVDSAKIATLLDPTDASQVKPVAVPEVAPVPDIADGADRWENHSMFSVNAPGDAKPAETTAEAVTGGTAVTSGSDQAPASTDSADALRHFLDTWLCNLPVQPESLRNARLPEFTLPALSEGNTGTPDVPVFTATVFDPTPYNPVTEGIVFAPVAGTEQYAVL